MLHAVVVWRRILVQVRLTPGCPQALVWAAHLPHGRVAHDARYSGLSHQSVKESKWAFNEPDYPLPQPSPLKPYWLPCGGGDPLSPSQTSLPFSLSRASVPINHLTGLVSCYYWQHSTSSSQLLIPTPCLLTNISPELHHLRSLLFLHPPA